MATLEKKKKSRPTKKKGTKKGNSKTKNVPKIIVNPPTQVDFSGKACEKETITFTLKNTTEKEILAFKIKPSFPKMFTVEPDIGLMKGGVIQSIKMTRTSFDPQTFDRDEDKVLIMYHKAPDGVQNAKQAWGRITENPTKIRLLINLPEIKHKENEVEEEEEEEQEAEE